jgi:hypothetical protein
MAKLQEGEKYLSIQILGSVRVAAFKNKNKSKKTEPDYIGNGVCVWISEKKAAPKPVVKEEDFNDL